jgi:subtilase family serine protease
MTVPAVGLRFVVVSESARGVRRAVAIGRTTTGPRLTKAAVGTVLLLSLAAALLSGCGGGSHRAPSLAGLDERLNPSRPPPPGSTAPVPTVAPDPAGLSGEIGLPKGSADEITFYFSLPVDDYTLNEAAKALTTPGTGSYRHYFTSYADAARTYGAKATDIEAAVRSVKARGLSVMVDPSRTFVRVWATAAQWQKVLGQPLKMQKATPSSPFAVYEFATVPKFDKLTYIGGGATVYDTAIDTDGAGGYGASVQEEATIDRARAADSPGSSTTSKVPWPINQGTFPGHTCVSGTDTASLVYAPSQIATAYDTTATHETAASKAARIAVIDLGGGYSPSDIWQADRCFGYAQPIIDVHTGDGLSGQIRNNNDETELDLQTVATFAPGATIQLIEDTNGPTSLLDAISRMLGNPHGFPDYASISYGQCAVQESQGDLGIIQAVERVVILGTIVGNSVFAAAGDWGSTTCGNAVKGTSQAFAASSTWVTAVGGTRLYLNSHNQRTDEVAWNDKPYGLTAAGGGGVSKVFARPWYQNDVTTQPMRVVPDFAFLADAQPGWPVVLNGNMESIGGTSASSPFAMAQLALLSSQERLAGRPRVGFINPWLYQLYKQHPDLFYTTVSGNNDLDNVGCCSAHKGFDEVSGLGIPNLAEIARQLPPPSP